MKRNGLGIILLNWGGKTLTECGWHHFMDWIPNLIRVQESHWVARKQGCVYCLFALDYGWEVISCLSSLKWWPVTWNCSQTNHFLPSMCALHPWRSENKKTWALNLWAISLVPSPPLFFDNINETRTRVNLKSWLSSLSVILFPKFSIELCLS